MQILSSPTYIVKSIYNIIIEIFNKYSVIKPETKVIIKPIKNNYSILKVIKSDLKSITVKNAKVNKVFHFIKKQNKNMSNIRKNKSLKLIKMHYMSMKCENITRLYSNNNALLSDLYPYMTLSNFSNIYGKTSFHNIIILHSILCRCYKSRCSYIAPSITYLLNHLKRKHGITFKKNENNKLFLCPSENCNFFSDDKIGFTNHILQHNYYSSYRNISCKNNSIRYKCLFKECKFSTGTELSYISHTFTHI